MPEANISKYQAIFEALQQQIASGKYSDGRRLPSEAELSKRFNVSRPTAARALRDLQNLGVIRRRAGSGSFLNSSPNGETSLANRTLGLLAPGLGNTEILDPICGEITRSAQSLGATVLWGDALVPLKTAEDALTLCRQFCERRVQGVFFAPMETVPDREAVNTEIGRILQQAGIAVVLLDRDIAEFPGRSRFDMVGIDNFAAGHVLADHLIALGNRRFRFLAQPGYPSTTDLRLAGCRESILAAKLKQAEPLAWFGDPADTAFVRKMLAGHAPEAILCSNDLTAAKLIQTLSGMGIRLPQDVRVVGFDDVRYATLLTVPLTTIHQPCAAIGAAAVRAMQDRIQAPERLEQQIFLPFKLIVRESCGSALGKRPAA